MPARLLVLTVLLLSFVGCRESLLAPEDAAGPQTPANGPGAAEVGFLKGPSLVGQGEAATFKAPADDAAVYYRWDQSGTGSFRIYSSAERQVDFVVVEIGEVLLEYVAYGPSDEPTLRGSRRVEILP